VDGAWTGVAENKGLIYALGRRGKCLELDSAGKTRREIKLPEDSGMLIRFASFSGEKKSALLTFSVWGSELSAFDLNGKQLWSYPRENGIDDVWAIASNGDKPARVIVGYNGNTGVHVLDGTKGKLLWKSAVIGNVWHVCSADVLGAGSPQVVTTSAAGRVHVFDDDGKKLKDLDGGCYATMVRVGKLSAKEKAATILVAGAALGGANQQIVMLTALSGDGAKKWSVALPAGAPPHIDSAFWAPGKCWLAVGLRGGQVHVVDCEKGVSIASVDDQGTTPEVGWAASNEAGAPPLLVVATGKTLNAFRLTRIE